jgi:hypothetical protein
MYQLYRIDNGVGSPLNDTQVLTGVFRPNTELVMKVIGDHLTVEAHNNANAETLSLEGTITPNDFGGAGAAWYGTVPRGNSNVYSRFEISYPNASNAPNATDQCRALPPMPMTNPSGGCGCALGGQLRGGRLLLGATVILALGVLAGRRRRRQRRMRTPVN